MAETTSAQNENGSSYDIPVILPASQNKRDLIMSRLEDVVEVRYKDNPEDKGCINLNVCEDPKITELAMELDQAHRPSDKKNTLILFSKEPNWQYFSQLGRQKTDIMVLEAVLKEFTREQLIPYVRKEFPLPDPSTLNNILAQHVAIADLYGRKPKAFQNDLQRIVDEYALKVNLDARMSDEMLAPRHGMLLNMLIRNRDFVQGFPDNYFPINDLAFKEAIVRRYNEVNAAEEITDISTLSLDTLNSIKHSLAKEIPTIRAKLGREAKDRLLAGMKQPLEQIVRTENIIPIDSRGPVHKITFSLCPTDNEPAQEFSAIVKTFDTSDPESPAEKNFNNERLAIKHFSRAGVLNNLYFTTIDLPQMHAIALNVINDEPLPTALSRPAHELPGMIHVLGAEAAKLHAYAPTTLSRGNVRKDAFSRNAFFSDRLIGDTSYFFEPLTKLFRERGILDKATTDDLEHEISRGLTPLIAKAAAATQYDTLCCDFRAENWFVRKKNGSWVCTKIDYETLRIAPAQMDLARLPITNPVLWANRHLLYGSYIKSYNEQAAEVNDKLVKRAIYNPHALLLQLMKRDVRDANLAGTDSFIPELSRTYVKTQVTERQMRGTNAPTLDALRRDIVDLRAKEKKPITNLQAYHLKLYFDDLSSFMGNFKEERSLITDEHAFFEHLQLFEFFAALEQTGIYAGNILARGQTQKRKEYITTNFSRVQELSNIIGFQLKTKDSAPFAYALNAIKTLSDAASKI